MRRKMVGSEASDQASTPLTSTDELKAKWHPAIRPVASALADLARRADQIKRFSEWEESRPGRRHPDRERLGVYQDWRGFCETGQLLVVGHKKCVFRVSYEHYVRGLRVLNLLAQQAAEKGYTVTISEKLERLQLNRSSGSVQVRLSEQLDTTFQTQIGRWSHKSEQVKVLIPTGRLSVFAESSGGIVAAITDKEGSVLEAKMSAVWDFIDSRHSISVKKEDEWAEWRRRQEQEKTLRDEQQRIEAEARQEREREFKRREALLVEARNWASAAELKRYLSSLDERISTGGAPSPDYAEWRAWAVQVAEDLDASDQRVSKSVLAPAVRAVPTT